jgi:dihydroflavonol-4-reductase
MRPGFLRIRMVVAVTGASGHIGANLVRALLDRGRQVRVLVHRDRRALDGLDLEIYEGSIRDPDTVSAFVQGVDVVYHLAAQISIQGSMGGLVEETNTDGTRHVVEACLTHQVQKLIHFSSIHALEDDHAGPDRMITERNPLALGDANAAYERSKAEAESVILAGVERGLNASIVNPGGVLGPFDFKPSRMGEVLIKLRKQKIPALVAGGFAWVDVRDVVDAAIAAQTHGKAGERYLLTGEWASFRQLAETVQKVTGAKAPRWTSPVWLAKFAVPFMSLASKFLGMRQLYTIESLCFIQCHRYVSSDKARRELGFDPRPLSQTLKDTYAWQQAQGLLE